VYFTWFLSSVFGQHGRLQLAFITLFTSLSLNVTYLYGGTFAKHATLHCERLLFLHVVFLLQVDQRETIRAGGLGEGFFLKELFKECAGQHWAARRTCSHTGASFDDEIRRQGPGSSREISIKRTRSTKKS
jgi:hypothetical protein